MSRPFHALRQSNPISVKLYAKELQFKSTLFRFIFSNFIWLEKTCFLIIFLLIQRHDFYVLDSSNFSFSSYLIPVVDFLNIKNVQALKFHIFTRSLSICHGLDSSDKRPYRFGCNCGIINRCSYTYVLIKNVQRYFKLEQSNTWA